MEKEIEYTPSSKLICEFLGSLFLVMAAISPIILFRSVLQTDIAIAVLADSLAVGFILFALIEIFGPVSGAHFNPVVTLAMIISKKMKFQTGVFYMIAQFSGGFLGMLFSHFMFYHHNNEFIEISSIARDGGDYFAEVLGTFILVLAIFFLIQTNSKRLSHVIGLLVGGQLIATSSTMFANPQVTLARVFTYSDAGIAPHSAFWFIIMEAIGAVLAVLVWKLVFRRSSKYKNKWDEQGRKCACQNDLEEPVEKKRKKTKD